MPYERKFIDGIWRKVWVGPIRPPRKRKLSRAQKFQRRRANAMRVYMRDGIKKHGITRKYNDKQMQIKRLLWALATHLGSFKEMNIQLGITKSGVSRWVSREHIPAKHYKKICELLGQKLTVGDLAKIVLD